MKRAVATILNLVLMIGLIVNCRGDGTPTWEASPTPEIAPTPRLASTATTTTQPGEPAPDTVTLTSFGVDLDSPFAQIEASRWEPASYGGMDYTLPLDLDQIVNRSVLTGLTAEQEEFLLEHGFVVMHSQEEQFHHIRLHVSDEHGQPYYLTTDAAFHALHLAFDELLKALEKEWLREGMIVLTQATLEELQRYVSVMEGTTLETELTSAIAYLSVAVKLFDPEVKVDASVADIVEAQIKQILDGAGKQPSVLFPEFEDDYGAYRPVGHYAGDPELEAYFRAMSWLGRVNFALEDESSSRIPLLVTMALRRAMIDEQAAAEAWAELNEVLTFIVGPTDDPGPPEFATLMDEVYGDSPTLLDLVNEALWSQFVQKRDELPRPRINSLFVDYLDEAESLVGWRFFGQRFTIDGFVLQNLIFDSVDDKPDGERRWLPTGPDVMAALGSEAAMDILLARGEDEYPHYLDQMAMLQNTVAGQTPEQWRARFYDAWLYAFMPLLAPKGDAYPNVMRTQAWAVREMNTCLGSWAELKHDTILYAKMPEGAGGGGPPCSSGPPPSYVEANPEAFYRMAYVARVIAEGLVQKGVISEAMSDWCIPDSLSGLTNCMADLGDRLTSLGDIAVKELVGEPLTADDDFLIQACLGAQECYGLDQERYSGVGMEPLPIVAAVAGSNIGILEAATGYVDRIFVVVPLDSRFYVAQGGIYSYYEFVQPRDDRLTDEAWRERLDGTEAPPLPSWSREFVFSGGRSTDVTGFYIGAAYEISEQGIGMGFRDEAGFASPVAFEVEKYTLLQIVDGPVLKDGETWWLFEDCFSGERGWAVQDARWFVYFNN